MVDRSWTLMVAAATLALAGCAPDLGPRPVLAAPLQKQSAVTFAGAAGQWPSEQWWSSFGDPQLDQLIREALASAPDVVIAAARLRQAQGLAEQAGGALSPQVNGEASVAAQKQSYNNGIPRAFVPSGINATGRLALNFSLDIDLWGRNRALLSAATSESDAARVDVAQAALLLSTGTAAAYADLNRYYAEQDLLERAVALQGETSRLVDLRVRNGQETQGQLAQARSAVAASKVQLTQVHEQIDLVRNQLAALTGAGPDRGRTIHRPALVRTSVGLPADASIALIGRRPDIVASRLRAAAAGRRIDAAKAAFYPNISLSGLIGLQSLGLSSLLSGSSSIGSVGPALTLPIFQRGALRGRFRHSRGLYDEAVASYDKTLTQAFREVADALVSQQSVERQSVDARTALSEAENAYRIARLRYQGGLSSYLDVLSAEQNVLSARRVFADVDVRQFALQVALIKSLGGGFAAPRAPQTAESR